MKRLKIKLIAATAAMLMAFPQINIFAADKTPQEIVDDMRLGWNLGNTLDSHGGGSDPDRAETYWVKVKTDKQMIDDIKAKGFNTVRVPVTWDEKLTDGVINENWLKRVKEIVDYCIDNNMYVILNTHHETGNIVPTYEKADASEAYLRNLWAQIAVYFKNYDEHLVFETLNEPRLVGGLNEWVNGTEENQIVINRLNKAAVEEIRKTGGNNASRLIMCPGNAAHIPAATSSFELPPDENIVLSVHNYAPNGFAMKNEGTDTWGSDEEKAEMNRWMKDLYYRFVSKGTPVVIGEMGATDKLNTSAREVWAKYYAQTAKSYGITCVVWDNNVITTDKNNTEEHFGLYNRASHSWYYEGIANALSAGVDAAVPYADNTDAYTTLLYSDGTVSLNNWDTKKITNDLPYLAEGYYITIKYTDDVPYLVVQNYNIGEWNMIHADKTENGTAYYSYESIEKACKTGYKNQLQMLVSAHGSDTSFTEVAVVTPHKNGDVTGDGKVDKKDAKQILITACGLKSAFGTAYADIDLNNRVDILDVIAALKEQ